MYHLHSAQPTRCDCFFTKIDGDLHAILYEDIAYIEAKKNYSEITMRNGKKLLIHIPIKTLEERLPDYLFCRIHRSYIISIYKITRINHHFVFLDEKKFPLTAQYYEAIEQHIDIVCTDRDSMFIGENPNNNLRKIS